MKKFLKLLLPMIIWILQETECENQMDKGINLSSRLILTSTSLTLDLDVNTVGDSFKRTSSEQKDSTDINIVDQRTKPLKTQNKENSIDGIYKGDKNNFRSEVNKTGNGTKTGIEKSEEHVKTLQHTEIKAAALHDLISEYPKSKIQLQNGNFTQTAKKVKLRNAVNVFDDTDTGVNVFDDTDTGVNDFDDIEEEHRSSRKRRVPSGESPAWEQNDNSHYGFNLETLREQYYDYGFGVKVAPRVPPADGRFEPPVLTDLSCWVCDWGVCPCELKRCDSILPYDGINSPKGYSCMNAEKDDGVLGIASAMSGCSYAESSFYDPCEELAKFTNVKKCRLCETDGCNTTGSLLNKWLLVLFFLLGVCSCCCLWFLLSDEGSECDKCSDVADSCASECPCEPGDGVATRQDFWDRESLKDSSSYRDTDYRGLGGSQGALDHSGDARRSHASYGASERMLGLSQPGMAGKM